MLFEELLTIIFCYFIPYKTVVSRHKKVIHCPPRNRRVKQYCTEFAKNIVVPDLVIATGRPINMVQIICNHLAAEVFVRNILLYIPKFPIFQAEAAKLCLE